MGVSGRGMMTKHSRPTGTVAMEPDDRFPAVTIQVRISGTSVGHTHGPGPAGPPIAVLPHTPHGLPRLAPPSRAQHPACASVSALPGAACSLIWPFWVGRASRSLRERCYRCPDAALISEVDTKDTKIAPHGPQTAKHKGAPQGPSGSSGRCVPSDARMSLMTAS